MATVSAYWRPTSVAQAFDLLDRPGAVVLAGGTRVNPGRGGDPVEVVDLQALDLARIDRDDDSVHLGAMATLQQVVDDERVPPVVRDAAHRELPSTLRNHATVGGCVATGDWESELLGALLVHETVVRVGDREHVETLPLEDVLAALPLPPGRLVFGVAVRPLGTAACARVARTPADAAIVAAFARRVGSRYRFALTGVAPTPVVVDGTDGLDPPGDFRGSAEYRRQLAATLLARVVEDVR